MKIDRHGSLIVARKACITVLKLLNKEHENRWKLNKSVELVAFKSDGVFQQTANELYSQLLHYGPDIMKRKIELLILEIDRELNQ